MKEAVSMRNIEKNGTAASQSLPGLKLPPITPDKPPVKQITTPSKKVIEPVVEETPKPVESRQFPKQVIPETMDQVDVVSELNLMIKSKPKVPEKVSEPKKVETAVVVATHLVAPSSPVP